MVMLILVQPVQNKMCIWALN